MFKRKLVSALLVMSMGVAALTGCSSASGDSEKGDSDKIKVSLLVTGALGDKGFNDSANAGIKAIEKQFGDNVEVETIEMGFDQTKFEPSLLDASESDADVIVTGGWDMKAHIENTASLYQDKKYIVYDTDVDYDSYELENVYSMTYKQNEAGFLAGALAALVTTSDMELANPEKKIGFVGARDTSAVINDFLVGYIEGAKFIDKDVTVDVSYVGSFTDSAKAKELTLAQYTNGVDVVFTSAGPASVGSIEAAAASKKYVLGVDSDQAMAYEGKDEQQYIISSALKRVDNSLVGAVEKLLNDELKFNTHEVLGVKEKGVELANNEIYTTTVPEAIRTKVEEVSTQIADGKIKVTTALGMDEAKLKEIIKNAK
ncbi:BMP family ABC transporter substrate-binding protein [Romboutsia weinsteinii]|uniref:BMP family ABC transporter substrate-binding protein n=1 Tax=Romboutsia weinsteinii TaxID=2020949 RepID=A0A371J6Y6_9FIRM|nr:BMP family ABC transporter substrate-binding protein [Romboutsia weinsteinii]RDY28540.1 BMP family ABC transporter substrate-binding protein [Romboutsia weinsteinii]